MGFDSEDGTPAGFDDAGIGDVAEVLQVGQLLDDHLLDVDS